MNHPEGPKCHPKHQKGDPPAPTGDAFEATALCNDRYKVPGSFWNHLGDIWDPFGRHLHALWATGAVLGLIMGRRRLGFEAAALRHDRYKVPGSFLKPFGKHLEPIRTPFGCPVGPGGRAWPPGHKREQGIQRLGCIPCFMNHPEGPKCGPKHNGMQQLARE